MTSFSTLSLQCFDRSFRTSGLLSFIPAVCHDSIGSREFSMQHSLSRHPLFSLQALAELADALPPDSVECHGIARQSPAPGETRVRPSELIHNLSGSDCRVVLWNLEQARSYQPLVDALLDEVKPLIPLRECGLGRREACVILASPGHVTPARFDPENNILLQLHGTRKIIVGHFPDRLSELKELDRYHDGHRDMSELPPASSISEMRAGEGIYLHPWAPYRIFDGPAASVSLAVRFRTGYSERLEQAHRFNAKLRRMGLSPRPAGESPISDWMKAAIVGARTAVHPPARRSL